MQEELEVWEQRVPECLRYRERQIYLDERIMDGGSVAGGKLNRLTKILLGRHPGLNAITG